MRPSLSFCVFQCSVFWICSIVLLSASLYVEIMHTGRLFSASLWCYCCYWCLCSRLLMPLLQTSDATDVTAVQSFYATDVNAADFWCLCSRLLMLHQMFLSAFLSLVIFQTGFAGITICKQRYIEIIHAARLFTLVPVPVYDSTARFGCLATVFDVIFQTGFAGIIICKCRFLSGCVFSLIRINSLKFAHIVSQMFFWRKS